MMVKDLSITDSHERCRIGTVADLLTASRTPDSKILNGLSFKDPLAGIERTSFSSDAHALGSVCYQEGWTKRGVPRDHLRWNLAATKHAFSWWHIDSDGYGTFVKVVTGSKLWIVGRPKDDLNFDIFNSTSSFAGDLSNFDVEAILLEPGSEL